MGIFMGGVDSMKATGVFNRTHHPLLREASSFKDAFREIKNVNVVVHEKGEGVFSDFNETTFSENSFREMVDCSNSMCYNGGVSIGHLVRRMVRSEETDFQMAKVCQGFEGSQKGKTKYRSCLNTFTVKIHIEYN
jgi:hypothetical protein